MAEIFHSARLKVKRADRYIRELERQITRFAKANPGTVRVQHDAGDAIIRIEFVAEIPCNISLTIGDAVHNLRTALDHMTWGFVGALGGNQNRYLKFPTGDSRASFESHCTGMVKESPQEVRDALVSLEAFPGGQGDLLYRLTDLDNTDKHTAIIPTIRGARLPSDIVVPEDIAEYVAHAAIHSRALGQSGRVVNIITIKDPPVGIKAYDYAEALPEIGFGDAVEAFSRESVAGTLSNLRLITAQTIEAMRKVIS